MKWLVSVVTLTFIVTLSNGAIKMQQGANDQGSLENCAKDKVPHLVVNWTPKDVQLGGKLKVHFEMTVAVPLDGGKANFTVWLPQYPDPIYQTVVSFSCDDFHKVMPIYCPFKAGQTIDITQTLPIPSKYPIPAGMYKIQAEVYNKQNAIFACLHGDISIKESQSQYDYMNQDYLG